MTHAPLPSVPGFTGSPLDRADQLRGDEAALAAMRADPRARLLRMDGLDPVPGADGLLEWAALDEAPDGAEIALLGLLSGEPRFVALTPPRDGEKSAQRSARLFRLLEQWPADVAGTYAAARCIVDWHQRHRFCANCGTATQTFRAGWARRCPNCRAEHFPRTDPVVIMLAEHGTGANARILVGRQKAWPQGRYSALAGFVEPGESIEEAVARELFEEAGVRVSSVRYLVSQPWPFPSQLMIGCVAQAPSDALTLDETEISEALWLTRAEVAAALDGAPGARFVAPPPYAIANTLFGRWLAEG